MTAPVVAPVATLIVTLVVFLFMLAEARLASAHERTLRARGAIEPADDVYRTMSWAYPACFLAMGIEGAVIGRSPGSVTLLGVVLFAAAKALKYWAISTLGDRWTFRVLVPPGEPRVTKGPYAWLRHPNYVAVVGELISFGLIAGALISCVVSVLGFGGLIRRRMRVEERVLGGYTDPTS